jgi:hypothetical protein
VNQSDARFLQAVGLVLGLAVTLHLVTGAKARTAHAMAGFLSLAALLGPKLA